MGDKRFRKKMLTSIGASGFNTIDEETITENIPINKICCRHENMFVDKKDSSKALINSIRKNGLFDPITVLDIEVYKKAILDEKDKISTELSSPELSKFEKENKEKNIQLIDENINYLDKMIDKGCEYFVSSGHRRFKAVVSLALNKDMYSEEGMASLYSEETREKIEEYLDAKSQNYLGFDQEEYRKEEYKFYEIPCKIENDLSTEKEDNIYSDSNITQRELSAYEVVLDQLRKLDKKGELDKIKESIKEKVVDNLNTRSLDRWIADYVKAGLLDKSALELVSDIDKKEAIMSLPLEQISKTKNLYNQELAKITSENSGREISSKVIDQTLNLLNTFNDAKKKMDIDILNYIYRGLISFRGARELENIMGKYLVEIPKNASNEKLKEVLKQQEIKTKEFKEKLINPIDEAYKQNTEESISNLSYKLISEMVKETKTIKTKSVNYTSKELIDMIYQVKYGRMTIDDLINKIEGLKKE